MHVLRARYGAPAKRAGGDEPPDAQAVRNALARLCRSSMFRAAPKRQAFLRFAVESVLNGEARHLKAYTIAVHALGRGGEFDPASDTIVRVYANRLREALRRYYQGEGAADPVTITIPRGSYVPRFTPRGNDQAANPEPLTDSITEVRDLALCVIVDLIGAGLIEGAKHADAIDVTKGTFSRLLEGDRSQAQKIA